MDEFDLIYYVPMGILVVVVILSIRHLIRHPLRERNPTSWGLILMLASIPIFSIWHFHYLDQNASGSLYYATGVLGWPFTTCLVAAAAFAVGDVFSWLIIGWLRRREY